MDSLSGGGPSAASSLASLMRHRVPLPDGLRAMAEDSQSKRMRRVYEELATAVSRGDGLSEALQGMGDASVRPLATLVAATDDAATQMAALAVWDWHEGRYRRESRRFRALLIYPLIILALALVAAAWLVRNIGKMYIPLVLDWDTQVPLALMWPYQVVVFLERNLSLLLGITLMLGTIWFVAVPQVGRQFIIRRIPLYGKALKWHLWSTLLRMAAVLVAGRVPLETVFSALEKHFYHSALRRSAHQLASSLRRGEGLASAFAGLRDFSPELVGFLDAAESSESVQTALDALADIAEERWLLYLAWLKRMIPPLLLIIAAAIIGFSFVLLASLLMPLMSFFS